MNIQNIHPQINSSSLTPFEQLSHSTVRIECDLPNGGIATGTGFFYILNEQNDQHIPVIITNKHVVSGSNKVRFLLTSRDNNGLPIIGDFGRIELDDFKHFWRPHPDPSIDLCVIPIAPLLREIQRIGRQPFFVSMDKTLLMSTEEINNMVGLESVTMIGYPNGLWDEANNLPIFRRGTLATDYKRDWNGKKEFLIDAACFPGSSGSPVMLFDPGSYLTKNGLIMGAPRVKLLGILYSVFQHTAEGKIKIVTVPTQQKAQSITGIPNNLGIIIKADQLLAFEELFEPPNFV